MLPKISVAIERMYRTIPHGRVKSIIKNAISYSIYSSPSPIENHILDGVRIQLYKDRSIQNKQLLSEVKGYITDRGLHKNDIVIDAGAYTGIFSIYAAKKISKNGKVIAFEPDPYNYIRLKKNIELNKISNIEIVRKALYSKIGSMKIDIQGFGSTIMLNQYTNQDAFNTIEVTTLDKELQKLRIREVNFVKMDIEGAEIGAVKGAKSTIRANNNISFAIASYHIVDGKPTHIELEKIFRTHRMKVYTGNKNHLVTYAHR